MKKGKVLMEMSGRKQIYRDENGGEIGTYKEDLDWITRRNLEPLRDFLNMTFDDDEAQKMAFIAVVLLERAEKKIYEAAEYLQNNYGTVEIERAAYNQSIEPETILGVVFTPCKEVTA